MTGEVTLRGRVLPVGGIKEKALAVFRSGIRVMILPEENRKEADEVPANITRKMKFIFVDHMDEVLRVSLVWPHFSGKEKEARESFLISACEPPAGLPLTDQP